MSTYIPASLRQQILSLDARRCAYCQSPQALMGVTFEIEHIIPISAGGSTSLENLCLSCPTCNRYKATRIAAQDPESHIEVSLFHPRRQNWTTHFAWSSDMTRVIGLTPNGRATIELFHIN
ncbi:HNH endonuclease domain protein [Candidatus Vecturithrix granuli]|uniref:HNH endonuclease domain protein n=1 Tax=Vecturithrix granuli TaxID=1499967 RepID=A0A081C885_VECG1|nr:HNH endonuclease domain protein [Candidatus Vecturithrix granuli]